MAAARPRFFSNIKSADEYFLPNLYGQTTNQPAPASTSLSEEAFFESDIERLDAELESIFGSSLQERHGANTDEDIRAAVAPVDQHQPPPPPATTVVPPIPRYDEMTRVIGTPFDHRPQRTQYRRDANVLVVNGPCALAQGKIAGTQASWSDVQAALEQQASTAGIGLAVENSNHEGVVIDHLLNATEHTTVILNCGDLLHAYPAIQKAASLSAAQVLLLNDTPLADSNASARQLTGFGAFGYKVALHAAIEQFKEQ
ncbi:Aste57867_20546 [Aphanomyces stellatus]|uniref:3-dehydroquinate dehydratase n=1 Tax=Aphanomyces stellatus TaxID=120398 RepID=A0A485LJY6_9STRA|nr:hypothetical protein As57867_020479 [Aphanomyces stellatus]VFT97231.1 Aste57867_20546 [Aphanomyces stellatus]